MNAYIDHHLGRHTQTMSNCRKKPGGVLEVDFFPTIVEEHAQRMQAIFNLSAE